MHSDDGKNWLTRAEQEKKEFERNKLVKLRDDYKRTFTANMIDKDQLNKAIAYIDALESIVYK